MPPDLAPFHTPIVSQKIYSRCPARSKRIRRFKGARLQLNKREVEPSRSQKGDFAFAIKRTIDHVYFIRQECFKLPLFWIEMANRIFKPRLASRSLGAWPGTEKAGRSAAFTEWIRNTLAARNRSLGLATSIIKGNDGHFPTSSSLLVRAEVKLSRRSHRIR